MVLMKGYDTDGFVFYSHIASAKGRELAANPKAALLFHWKSLRRQVRIRGNGDAGDGSGGRRLFRHAGRSRRRSAPGPASSRSRWRAASPSSRRSRWSPPNISSARCRVRPDGAAGALRLFASSSGTTGRSGCTTASNSAATGRCRPGRRCGSIPDVERLTQLHALFIQRAAAHAAPDRCQSRHRPCHRDPLLLGRLARHHLLAACLSGSLSRGARVPRITSRSTSATTTTPRARSPKSAAGWRTTSCTRWSTMPRSRRRAMAAARMGTMDTDIETWSHVFPRQLLRADHDGARPDQ